jgi:signal transduction histidine kinase/ligand-binding sensor domain-containing protein/ActR/RegA family two-component response regulator
MIEQTPDGFVWFGTKDGLARYDGGEFKVYRHEPGNDSSLPGNAISALHADLKGKLWVGISGRGLVRMNPATGAFVHFPLTYPGGPTQDVWSVESTADGATWFGTFSDGLYRLSKEGNWQHFSANGPGAKALPSDEVMALAVDGRGTLWAGTGRGLIRWSSDHFVVEDLEGLVAPRVVMLEADSQGLWVGTPEGLRLITNEGLVQIPSWQSALPHPVYATELDAFGTRWFSTSDGLIRERNGKLTRVNAGAPQGLAFGKTLLEDTEGGLWVAQRGYGVMYSPASWRRFSTFGPNSGAFGTNVAWVRAFAEASDGDVWLAGVGGLDKFHPDTGTIDPVLPSREASGCRALSVAEISDGSVWLGCMDGLVRFDPRTHALKRWSERSDHNALQHGLIESIVQDKEGVVWVGGEEQIQARDHLGNVLLKIEPREMGGGRVRPEFKLGPDGQLWVETTKGIFRWHNDKSRFKPVAGLPATDIRAFGFGRPGLLWMLRGDEIEGYRWNGSRMVLDRRNHVAIGEVVAVGGLLVDSRDRIWLTTGRGLVRVDPADSSVRAFNTDDGLPSQEFESLPPLMTREGLIYASTTADFVVFNPSGFQTSPIVPTVQLDSITLRHDDAIVEIPNTTTRIVLGADDRDLRITARIASLSEPRSRRFRFRLDGYDRDWIEDHEGERVFTRLEHGDYVMEVCAATADGVWSPPRRLEIVVLPRWWQTVPARAAFAMLLVGLVLVARAAYRARLRSQHEKQVLEERRALAEQASQAKSRFLADLGHEIRTPMTGVLGMAELMHADASDERQRTRIEAIQSAGRHLLVLLNDALDLARIEAGRLELQDVAFDLPALLADACALLRPQAEAKRLAFTLELPPDLPRGVRGDPVRLRQILLNLGHNAVKFTTAGRIRICATAGGDRLHVDVEDTGPGMDAAQVARLFGRFEQADGARTSADFGGSGLGLSICRELAQAMRGDIEVDSAPGRGTRFRVTLPLVLQALPEPASLSLRVREPDGEGARILVVEDDALVGEVVCGLLEHLGHRARHVAHGLEGLAAVAGEPFDLIVVDLDLPGIDGFELARLLRLQGRAAPIVALTARADAGAEARARAAGMVDFLRKPVTGEALAAMVARHARREPQPA